MAGETGRRGAVIGENMAHRVIPYAQARGLEYFTPPVRMADEDELLEADRAWLQAKIQEGVIIIDIGPDMTRRFQTGYVSRFYEMERREVAGYIGLAGDEQP